MKTKFLKAAVLLATVRLTFAFAKNITERIVYDGIPRELVRLKNRNPETADFVDGFRENAARNFEIDLSDRARLAGEGEVPLLLQWDERWGYRKYRGEYRAISACGPTVMSMAAIWVFEDEKYDPRYMMDFAREGGWRSPGSGTLHSFISRGGKELGLDVKEINPDEERVKSAFSRGGG